MPCSLHSRALQWQTTARRSLRQIEISDAVVRRRAEPHAAFVVEEEVAHAVLGARQRIFGHFAGVRIEPPDDVHVLGGVPDLLLGIDPERLGRRFRAGQPESLEGLSLGIGTAGLTW